MQIEMKMRYYDNLKQEIEAICEDNGMANLMIQNLKSESVTINRKTTQNYHWRINLESIHSNINMIQMQEFESNWGNSPLIINGKDSEYTKDLRKRDYEKVRRYSSLYSRDVPKPA